MILGGKTQSQRAVADLATPGPIGASTPAAITGTIITATGQFLAPGGTPAAPAYGFSSGSYGFFINNGTIYVKGRHTDTDYFSFGGSAAGYLFAPAGFALGSGDEGGWDASSMRFPMAQIIAWSSTINAVGIKDIGLRRNAAGVLEVHDGITPGALRDLKLRAITATGSVAFGTSGTDTTGFYGKAPVAQAAAIASPTAPGTIYAQAEAQSMKTAVDAIRVALTNIGITL